MITYEGTEAIPRIPVHRYAMSAAGVRVDHLYHAGALDDLASRPRVDLPPGQERQCPVGVLRPDDGEHSEAHVERALHLAPVNPALGLYQVEDRLRAPPRPVDHRVEMVGQHAGQVARDPAPGDVRERAYLGLGDQGEAVLGVNAGRSQQLLTEG